MIPVSPGWPGWRFPTREAFADCGGEGLWLNLVTMPQMQLPLFHEGTQLITPDLGYRREGKEVVYLHGMMPVFLHQTDDIASFRMIISQFYINGIAKQSELVRTFAINALALKRWVKKYREEGPKAFYETRRRRPGVLKKSP